MNRLARWLGCSLATVAVVAIGLIAVSDSAASATATPAPVSFTAYTTGYGWWDNTPPGSSDIAYPVIHQTAGGTGTYADPITVAVGHVITNGVDTPDFAPGTIWYVPNLRRYFIVEDACGDGSTPQDEPCHDLATAPQGAQVWLDLWVDGSQMTHAGSNACEDAITGLNSVIENPAPNYAVVSGPVAGSTCSQQYGNTLVTTSSTPTPPPAAPTPPASAPTPSSPSPTAASTLTPAPKATTTKSTRKQKAGKKHKRSKKHKAGKKRKASKKHKAGKKPRG